MPVTDPERAYEAIAAAIAILTAWLEGGNDLTGSVLLSYVEDDDLSDPELIRGFLHVAGILLVKLEKHGNDPQSVLQDIASRYQPG